jgi:hypothetical protein
MIHLGYSFWKEILEKLLAETKETSSLHEKIRQSTITGSSYFPCFQEN